MGGSTGSAVRLEAAVEMCDGADAAAELDERELRDRGVVGVPRFMGMEWLQLEEKCEGKRAKSTHHSSRGRGDRFSPSCSRRGFRFA